MKGRGGKSARKLSVRTNESSPFARLSPTLMAPPMLRCLPHIIKLAQASGNLCASFFLCLLRACVRACMYVCVSRKPPGEASSSVCHTEHPFFLILPLSTAKMTECNASHEREKRKLYSLQLYFIHTHSQTRGKEGATSSAEPYLSEICTCQWRSKTS